MDRNKPPSHEYDRVGNVAVYRKTEVVQILLGMWDSEHMHYLGNETFSGKKADCPICKRDYLCP